MAGWLLGGALALAALGGAGLLVSSWWRDAEVAVEVVGPLPAEGVHIGVPADYRVRAVLPWHRRPYGRPEVLATEPLQVVGTPAWHWRGLGAGKWTWEAEIVVQAYGFEPSGTSRVSLHFTADRQGRSVPVVVDLPAPRLLRRQIGETERELATAGELGPPSSQSGRSGWYWLGLAVVLLAVAGVLVAIWRAKETGGLPPKPCWELAELALQRLEERLPMPAEAFFVELSDIVRDYLEARFLVPAAERTTPEFISMVGGGAWLTPGQRDRLGEFLLAADLVKFAQAEATLEQMGAALERAAGLVAETRPPTGGDTAAEEC